MAYFPGGSVQSTVNSSVLPLPSATIFKGEWELVNHPDVMVVCKTDNTGTILFDFSPDGSNIDSTFPPNGFKVANGINEFHTALKGPRYFRVRMINDTGAQTYMRLYTYFGKFGQGNLPINASIGSDADAKVVRMVDPSVDLALGRIGGMMTDVKFGRIASVSAASDIWGQTGTYKGHPVSYTPELVTVVSTSTADTSAGTGARTVQISGLKTSTSTSYESETITMNGTTLVDSVSTWWRVNRVTVLTAGTGAGNAGVISCAAKTTTTNIFGTVQIAFNQSQIAAYTVPYGKQILIKRYRCGITRSGGSSVTATISFRIRETGSVYRAIRTFEVQGGSGVEFTAFGGQVFPASTDMKFRVETISAASAAEGTFEYLLIDT